MQFQTAPRGALAIFRRLQNALVLWNFVFSKLARMLTLCQKLVLLGRKRYASKKNQNKNTPKNQTNPNTPPPNPQNNPQLTMFCTQRFVLILEKVCCCQTQGSERLFCIKFKVLLCISRVSLQHLSSEMPTKVPGPVCGCILCVHSYSIAFTERNLLAGCFNSVLLKSRCNDNASVSAYWKQPEKLLKLKLNGVVSFFHPKFTCSSPQTS